MAILKRSRLSVLITKNYKKATEVKMSCQQFMILILILIVNLIPQTMEGKGSRFSLLFLNPSQMDNIAKYSRRRLILN